MFPILSILSFRKNELFFKVVLSYFIYGHVYPVRVIFYEIFGCSQVSFGVTNHRLNLINSIFPFLAGKSICPNHWFSKFLSFFFKNTFQHSSISKVSTTKYCSYLMMIYKVLFSSLNSISFLSIVYDNEDSPFIII